MKIATVTALLSALLTAQVAGAPQGARGAQDSKETAKPYDLARARSAFAGADKDASASLSPQEAVGAGYTERRFKVFDLDGDGGLSQSEFVIGYKQMIAGQGHRVAPDLEHEARRLLAAHRAEQARRERERSRAIGPAVRRRATASSDSREKKPPVASTGNAGKVPVPSQRGVAVRPPVLPPPAPGSGPGRTRIQEQMKGREDPKKKEVPEPKADRLGGDAGQGGSSGKQTDQKSEKKGGGGDTPAGKRTGGSGRSGAERSSTRKRDGTSS